MVENIEELRNLLKVSVLQAKFVKSDDTLRVMRCTLIPSKLPEIKKKTTQAAKKKPATPNDNVVVYDLDKNGWRSFDFKSLKEYSVLEKVLDDGNN